LVPIPLHVKKLRKRGYNQSERLAAGVAEITGIRLNNKLLRRKSSTQTQTRKSRYERWVNVSEVFELSDPEAVEGKPVMLVDDVITTGATLESAAQVLLDAGAAGVVVVAFASALR